MSTSNLRVLEDYEVDEGNFDFFADVLALWASQYVSEIALPIATYAHELFEVQAVRILLGEWHDAYKEVRRHQRDEFRRIATSGERCCLPQDLESPRKDELDAFNTALYALIVM